jgi:hypothetical protein
MRIPVSIRWAVCAAALTAILALAGATTARAQGAAGAGSTSTTAATPAPPRNVQPGQTSTSSESAPQNPQAANSNSNNQVQNAIYEPITASQRVGWVLRNTVEPQRLLGDAVYAGIETAQDDPKVDGTHWDGFGKRAGILLAGAAVSNTMEATLGSFWGEDPRYFRVPDESFGARVKSVFVQTFVARGRDGSYHPAYARYMAIPGSNWLSNTWRPDAQADNEDAAIRSAEGFGARMASNAYNEFWPSVSAHIFHRNK